MRSAIEMIKFTIKGGHVPYKMTREELEAFLREQKRGCGSHKSKRDYNRKKKVGDDY